MSKQVKIKDFKARERLSVNCKFTHSRRPDLKYTYENFKNYLFENVLSVISIPVLPLKKDSTKVFLFNQTITSQMTLPNEDKNEIKFVYNSLQKSFVPNSVLMPFTATIE